MRKAPLLTLMLILTAETAEAQTYEGLFMLATQGPEGSMQPNLDGVVHPYEYYDGRYFDFQSFTGATDGRGYILASGSEAQEEWDATCTLHDGAPGSCKRRSIYLGLEVPLVTPAPAYGQVIVYLDYDHAYYASQLDDVTRPADRQLRIEYSGVDPATPAIVPVVVTQLAGTDGSWANITGDPEAYVTAHAVSNTGDAALHVELRIEVLPSDYFGLAITHVGATGGSFHAFPDDSVTPVLPSTWETVGWWGTGPIVEHSFATFNVGQHVDVPLCQILGNIPACTFFPMANAGSGGPDLRDRGAQARHRLPPGGLEPRHSRGDPRIRPVADGAEL